MRVLIVDDEALSRHLIREYLAGRSGIEIVGEAENGFDAVKLITELAPDLVFLDIQMPKLTGFEVLELVGPGVPVVFTTAYDQFAIRAFEVNAVDYLLKPFSQERFDKAIERFRQRTPTSDQNKKVIEAARGRAPIERILIKDGSSVTVIPVSKIAYIAARDDYAEIHTDSESYLKQQPLTELESQLDSGRFVRVHRSFLVNIERIARVESSAKDSKCLILKSGTQIPVSRSGYERIRSLL